MTTWTPGRLSAYTLATAILTACNPSPPPPITFLTRAERTEYRETSSHADVVDFLQRAAATSPSVHYTTYGYTNEGRALPLAVVGDLEDPSPASVRATGKTVVYLQGNIHGGEVCGKEALQMLLRDLLAGRHGAWRESMVLLIGPIYNADGNERVSLTNRGRQHGPIGGMGQRPNAQGYDLNRDHMKLESPEARSVARLFSEYDPHVAVDLHTTNGTRHAYHITYSPPLHPNTPVEIDDFLREGLLPHVTEEVRDKHGWEYYYYGNAYAPGGGERGWYTFDHRPRFNNNYIGLRSGSPERRITAGNRLTTYRTARSAFSAVVLDPAGPYRESGKTGLEWRESDTPLRQPWKAPKVRALRSFWCPRSLFQR